MILPITKVWAYNIDDHWAKAYIDTEFYDTYLQEYSGELTLKLLDQPMEERLYQRTLVQILDELTGIVDDVVDNSSRIEIIKIWENDLTRKSLAVDTVEQLEDHNVSLTNDHKEILFKDIKDLSSKELKSIKLLYESDILNGYTAEVYGPDDKVTYAQGIIILERLQKKVVEIEKAKKTVVVVKPVVKPVESQDIRFTVKKGNGTSEGLVPKLIKDKLTGKIKLVITITKKFPDDAYHLKVTKIIRNKDGVYDIYLKIDSPKLKDLTQKDFVLDTVDIEIEEDDLGVESLDGEVFNFSLIFET